MFKRIPSNSEWSLGSRTYSSIEVARMTRATLRQIQWWDERKLIMPRHEGHRRIYIADEVLEIAVLAELRRKGLSLQQIRRILRYMRRELSRHLAAPPSSGAKLYLFTDGRSVSVEYGNDQIIERLKYARHSPVSLVCVSEKADLLFSQAAA